jgi:two-component system sensor histidine kinase CreC
MTRLVVVAVASIGLILLVAFFANRLVKIRRRGLSIRMQVFIALASVIGAFAFGLGVMVLDRIEARAVRFASQSAEEKAAVVARLLSAEMEDHGTTPTDLAAALPRRARDQLLEDVQILGKDEQLLWDGNANVDGEPSVAAVAPLTIRGQVVGTVRVAKTTVAVRRLLKDFAPTVLVISLLLGATAALAALWIGQTVAEPIEALTQFASSVSAGEDPVTPRFSAGREVTRLTQSIDSMRRQLQGRPFVETFAADLSHELKNPVAAIRAAAEVLDDSALEEPDEARRFVHRIQEAVARIERLLGDLLSLARIEARGVEELDLVSLETLLRSAVSQLPPDRLLVHCDANCRVRGDAGWLSRAISNLLDNAAAHSNGEIHVSLTHDPVTGNARLTVANPGAIDRHTRSRLFGRFVTTRAHRGGTGLGLAIVRAVAEAHHGHVELDDPGPPQVRFTLTLPLA